jgi:hypothetical protein
MAVDMEIIVFWDVTLCSLVRSPTLKVEAASSSEMLETFYQIIRRQMPDGSNLHILDRLRKTTEKVSRYWRLLEKW